MEAKTKLKLPEIFTKMHSEAVKAFKNSYSPYSKFPVGAAVLYDGDQVVAGTNVENPCHLGVCAERTAIFYAASKGMRKLEAIVVVTDQDSLVPPCGACLQVIAEFCKPDLPIYLGNLKEIQKKYTFKELMPHAYGPSFLAAAEAKRNKKSKA